MNAFPRVRLMASFPKKLSKTVAIFLATVFACALVFSALWTWVFPRIFVFDETMLDAQFPATLFRDREGNPVHVEPGADWTLRFPVPLSELPPHLIAVTLAAEDRNFFGHDGVDLCAAARAGLQLAANGRIVSGASTVTMQLVALAEGRRERSFARKFVQMCEARNLELRRSKEEILEEYLNRLPYGGKIYGVEAAARHYFGHSARELTLAESVMLAGIPQRPNRLRPDRFPEAARERRDRVLAMLVRQGALSEADAVAVAAERLRFRDFSRPAFPRAADPQFFLWLREREPNLRGEARTTADASVCGVVGTAVRSALEESFSVRDGAAVVVENATRSVRAFLGTVDFSSPKDGQVNAALARRSPGSLLKPFIFGEAINAGLLVADTVLDDSPLTLADYRPGNFSGTYLGKVSARTALSKSLNTPAVRVLRDLGPERVFRVLDAFGVRFAPEATPERAGLSLALGGAETNLVRHAEANAARASGGVTPPRRVRATGRPRPPRERVWSAGAAEMTLRMLRETPLPGAEHLPVAWKTGTSNGLRDAWCVAVTPEWTVAVWFGNKSGAPAPELVGAEIAAPVAGRILAALYRGRVPAPWNDAAPFRAERLCAASGLRAGDFCAETRTGTALVGVPLRVCGSCRSAAGHARLSRETKILEPRGGVYRRGANGKTRFVVRSVPAAAHWYLDGAYLGFFKSGSVLELAPGTHTLFVWPGLDFDSAKLFLEVK